MVKQTYVCALKEEKFNKRNWEKMKKEEEITLVLWKCCYIYIYIYNFQCLVRLSLFSNRRVWLEMVKSPL